MEAPLTIPIDSFWETQWWCLVNNVISVPIATIIMCIIYVWIKRHWCFASFVIWWFLKNLPIREWCIQLRVFLYFIKRLNTQFIWLR